MILFFTVAQSEWNVLRNKSGGVLCWGSTKWLLFCWTVRALEKARWLALSQTVGQLQLLLLQATASSPPKCWLVGFVSGSASIRPHIQVEIKSQKRKDLHQREKVFLHCQAPCPGQGCWGDCSNIQADTGLLFKSEGRLHTRRKLSPSSISHFSASLQLKHYYCKVLEA